MTDYFGNLSVHNKLHNTVQAFSTIRELIFFPYKLFDHLHLDEGQRN